MSAKRLAIAFASVLLSLVVLEAAAQFELPKRIPRIPLPGLDRIPGMDKLLGKEVPVTTSLPDVLTEVPFLDFYTTKFPMSAGYAERGSDGQFSLAPGAWTYQAQSYCLKAGTHGPGRGEGYGYAPLKGPKAPIVQSILRRSVDHPEIKQNDVQYLLWAIIARAKLSEMSRENQATAAKLLTPKEMFDLNGGALGILPESAKAKLMADLPPALKAILEAENRIRQMVTQANASFAEVERVAVLLGEPAPDAADRMDLPRQRWSYHPDGYFIRFDPHGYSSTNVDIYVPKPYTIVRDRKDRIVLISDDEGRRIDILYTPSTVKVEASMRAYRFDRVRFADASIGKASVVGEWKKTGWTLVGVPDDSNTVAGETLVMTDISTRLVSSRKRAREFENVVKQVGQRGQKSSPQALVRDLVDLAHLQDALSALPAKKTDKRVAQQLDQVAEAWQYTLQRGVTERADQRASLFPPEGPGESASRAGGGNVDVDPSENVGVPGQTGRQRLGQSARCGKECGCDRKKFCSDLNAAISTLAREMSNATSTRASIAQAGQQKLKDLAKGLCDNPELAGQIQDMINQLNSASSGTALQGYQTIARVQNELDAMQKQVCGGPPPPKNDCPDGTKPATPGDEQAGKQVTDALDKARRDLLDELRKFDEGVPDYIQRGEAFKNELMERMDKINTLINLWNTFKNTKCIPPNIIPLMRQVLENQRNHTPNDAECTMLCAETAKWYGKLINSPGSYQEKLMLETCLAWCH